MKLIMLKGLPGSGKSTWALNYVKNNPSAVRINRDSLREMIGNYRSGKDERLIVQYRDMCIVNALIGERTVVVDDTNFDPAHEKALRIFAEHHSAQFEEVKFDTPLNDCIKNDLKRNRSVGERVIRKMYNQYLAPKPSEPPTQLPGFAEAIIVDIDGTVALHTNRRPYDAAKCSTDTPNKKIVDIVRDYAARGNHILFVSGREEKYKEVTQQWMYKNSIPFHQMWMRPTSDFREDSIVKQEIYDMRIRGKYNVDFVLDDRNRVVDMWRRNGLTCLQVAPGDF